MTTTTRVPAAPRQRHPPPGRRRAVLGVGLVALLVATTVLVRLGGTTPTTDDLERITLDDDQPLRPLRHPRPDRLRQGAGEQRVELDGHDLLSLFQQPQGQRPQPRPDFEHRAPGDVGEADQAADRVRVEDEVLTLRLGRPEFEPSRERPDVGTAEQAARHQLTFMTRRRS